MTSRRFGQKNRILVVDDNPESRKIVCRMLEKLGHDFDELNDGREAVRRLQQDRYDLVLLDCLMPGFDGYQTARLLREKESPGQRVPVIAVTAYGIPGDRERCLESGMDDHLSKPFGVPELKAILERWLDRAPQRPSPLDIYRSGPR